MKRTVWGTVCLVVTCGGVLATSAEADDFVGHPVTGAAIVTNGLFTNIYVYPNSDTQTWEQHLAAVTDSTIKPVEDFSRARIDAFTASMMSGWPGYFDALMQYRTIDGTGISPPQFVGSKVASKACVDAALKDADSHGVVQWATLRSLANCHVDGQDPSPQVNLIISPDIKVGSPNFGPDTNPDMCTTDETAYHAWGVNVPNFTVVPTDRRCNPTFVKFTASLSHEVVETLSDPAGFGYLNGSPSADNYAEGELSDICEAKSGAKKNPSGDPGIAYTTYHGYQVSRYWSNFDNDCIPRVETPANADSVLWVLGAGAPLVRLTGKLRDFDIPIVHAAPDLPITQLRLFVQTGGDDLRGDKGNLASVTVHFRNGDQQTADISASRQWNNNETHAVLLQFPAGALVSSITGLTLHKDYDGGTLDCCGDNWNVDRVALMVSYPQPPAVTSIVPAAGSCQGSTNVVINGAHLDGGTVRAVPQVPIYPTLSLATTAVTSNAIALTLPGGMPSGTYEMVVTTPVGASVQPALSQRTDLFQSGAVVSSVSPASGPAPGGTMVTISGQCFGSDPNVRVYFNDVEALKGYDQCESSVKCIVASPPGAAGSQVDVNVSVNGAPSASSEAARFTYTGPSISRLTPTHGPKSGGTAVEIDGDGFPPYLGLGNNMPVAFGAVRTSALCLGSSVSATTSCMVTTPAVGSAGAVQVVGTAFGTTTPQTPASVFIFDDFPQVTKLQLPGPGIVEQRGVFLNGNAPAGGASVALQSSDPSVSPPATVTVVAGQAWADVPINVRPSPVAKVVTVTATYQGSSQSTTVAIDASPPLSIGVSGTVTASSPATLTATLNRPASGAGARVTLVSADPVALPLPKSVTVPSGAYSVSVPLTSAYIGKPKWVDIVAQSGKSKATSSVWLTGAMSNPPVCKPRTCAKGWYWDSQQCLCIHGVPQ